MNPGELPVRQDGDQYVVDVDCFRCGEPLELRSDEPPTRMAMVFARRMFCDDCAAASEAEDARRRGEVDRRNRIDDSGLPAALRGLHFDDLNTDGRIEAIEAVRTWAQTERPKRGVCLFGDVGVGKTRIAATGSWERLRRFPCGWVSVPVLIANVGAGFGDDERRAAIRTIAGKGTLVLDDLDKVNPSEWARSQLFAAIDTRVQSGAPLLITTNLPPSKLAEKFGQAIVSRIVGACDVYELAGRDRRLFA